MHEMSLAEGILQLVEETARREQAHRVGTVIIEIGQLSSVEPDALRFCFDAVAAGTLAQGAKLEIIDIAGAGWCPSCNQNVAMSEIYATCPHCGNYQLQAKAGMEMRVKAIEIT